MIRARIRIVALGFVVGAGGGACSLLDTNGLAGGRNSEDASVDAPSAAMDAAMDALAAEASTMDAPAGDAVDAGADADADADAAETSVDATVDPAAYEALIREDHPFAYWTLDDRAGKAVIEDEVDAYAAEARQVSFGVPGAVGTGMLVSNASGGTSSQLDAGSLFDVATGQAFTIELWFKPESTPTFSYLVKKLAASPKVGYQMYTRTSPTDYRFELDWEAGTLHSDETTIDDSSTFHHLVQTMDTSGVLQVYQDGAPVGPPSPPADGGAAVNAAPLVFGLGCAGVFDEIALYRYALTSVQVAAHFRAAGR